MATKERSPNYPAYSLRQAVEWARNLYASDKRNAVPIDTVAKATGSEAEKGISGPARQKIAAIRQYGLIDSAGHGSYRITPVGFDLAIHDPNDPEYKAALQKAALTPTLFADIYHQYPELPSDHTLKINLMKAHDFGEDGARRFLKAFRETLSFAKLDTERYNVAEDGASGEHSGADEQSDDTRSRANRGSRSGDAQRKREADVGYSWPLGGGNKVELGFASEPTQAQLDVMLAQLQIMRQVAPAEAQDKDISEGGE